MGFKIPDLSVTMEPELNQKVSDCCTWSETLMGQKFQLPLRPCLLEEESPECKTEDKVGPSPTRIPSVCSAHFLLNLWLSWALLRLFHWDTLSLFYM